MIKVLRKLLKEKKYCQVNLHDGDELLGFITDLDLEDCTFEIYGFNPIPVPDREIDCWDDIDCAWSRKTYDISSIFGIEHDIMSFMSPERVKVVNFYLEHETKLDDRGMLFLVPKGKPKPKKPRNKTKPKKLPKKTP